MAEEDKYFNVSKYGGIIRKAGSDPQSYVDKTGQGETISASDRFFFSDGSDALANDGLVIGFTHVPSDSQVFFKAFISTFNETYSSDWSEEVVFGRADPIRMFKQNTRSITLSFQIPAATVGEGFENLGKLQKLIKFLYPNYVDADNAITIAQSPLIRLNLMSLINSRKGAAEPHAGGVFTTGDTTTGAPEDLYTSGMGEEGLLGNISNLNISHNIDNPDYGVFNTARGTIIPKMIEVALDFQVTHEYHLGWDPSEGVNGFSQEMFPYGVDLRTVTAADMQRNYNNDATAYSQEIEAQRKEEEDLRQTQAQIDIAKSEFLKADGTVNTRKLERMRNKAHGTGGKKAFRNEDKRAYYAKAVEAMDALNAGSDVNGDGSIDAQDIQSERFSWIS